MFQMNVWLCIVINILFPRTSPNRFLTDLLPFNALDVYRQLYILVTFKLHNLYLSVIRFLKCVSIVAYLLIFLNGDMISIPLGLVLIFDMFGLNISSIFAGLAWCGLALVAIDSKGILSSKVLRDIVILLLLLSPLFFRLTNVPLHLFNYPGFILPLSLFLALYMFSMILEIRELAKSIHSIK
jgi:hypothetical protein